MHSKQASRIALAVAVWFAPFVGTARALDLETALARVAEANPTLAAQRAMVEAARRRIAPARAWSSPMLELGAVNVPPSGRFDQEPMTMKMVGVAQRVPVFGSNRLAGASARSAAEAQGAASEMTHYNLFAMAWQAYADAYYAGQMARRADVHQGEMDRLVQAARARYESGAGRLDDVLRAQAEQARTLADLASFRADAEAGRAGLDALMGSDPGAASDTLASPPTVRLAPDAAAWTAAVTPEHPHLRELAAEVERYRFAARASRRMVWPDLELRGSYGVREKRDNMWTAMVGFMLPLFAGQRELSEGAEMDASQAELRAATLELQRQVTATHATALSDQRTVALLADTVVTTQRRALEASWSAYQAGSTDLWRVLEATHELYNEEIALLRSRRSLSQTEARLLAITARADLLGIELPAIQRSER
jgi:outer membrane protein TolC